MTGCGDDPAADCGSGRGYEWVGWRGDPTITFEFGTRCDFTAVRIYSANRPDRGAPLWGSVTVSLSDDGLRFRKVAVRSPLPMTGRSTGSLHRYSRARHREYCSYPSDACESGRVGGDQRCRIRRKDIGPSGRARQAALGLV